MKFKRAERPTEVKKDGESHVPAGRCQVQEVIHDGENIMPLVLSIVKRIPIPQDVRIDHEAIVAEALYGLSKAIPLFDGSRGAKFSTFAFTRIRGAILDMISRERKYNIRFQLEHPDDFDLQESTTDLDEQLDQRLLFVKVSKILEEKLPLIEATVLVRTFLEGRTDEEIGTELSMDEFDIPDIRNKGLAMVREYFPDLIPTINKQ
jgi:RNA polymerase sigma factor (sigma-70 family)